jgi:hypothetical protein
MRSSGTQAWGVRELGIAIALKTSNSGISFLIRHLMESQIKESLTTLLAGIKSADGQTVAAEMEKLDAFLEQGRVVLHPQLVHFLQNRSYAKAVMFLGGETDIPVGACGGKKS